MRILDFYCKAGGCTRGYQLAGFEVVGVDIEPQPKYIGDYFEQADALDVFRRILGGGTICGFGLNDFDAFSASPPCQNYSKSAKEWRAKGKTYPDLIGETREYMIYTGKPYIIENVPGAPLLSPIVLNGSFFGIKVHRPRLFECSFYIHQPIIPAHPRPIKMGRPIRDGDYIQPVGHFSGVAYAQKQMGIDWMGQSELAQAIPPSYTEWIGKKLVSFLKLSGALTPTKPD